MNLKIVSLTILFTFQNLCAVHPEDDKKLVAKPNLNDRYIYIAANNILMWISNNGDGSHDPRTDGNGFYWPGGINAIQSAIFEDGLLFGAKVGDEIRVNGNTHRQGLQAGKIINGLPDDPSLEKYRVYKIRKDWDKLPPGNERDALEKDYKEWPIEDGAPYIDINEDGKPTPGIDKPRIIGDETLWYVANDMDSVRSNFTYGMAPMGLEFQTTVFAFKNTSALNDVVFKKYRIINKGNNILKDMYLSYWSDPDMGDAGDDYVGFDTVSDLAYTWNGDNNDDFYGTPPPAVGYILVQGPKIQGTISDSALYDNSWIRDYKNIPVTAFINIVKYGPWRDPQQGVPGGSIEFYNYMQGKSWDGTPIINPVTGEVVTKMVTGDPVSGTGWYEGTGWPGGSAPGDRRLIMSSGSFTMNPGDTQEVVIAIAITNGSSNVFSVPALRNLAERVKIFYNKNLAFNPPPPLSPVLNSVPMDGKITLWWGKTDESYTAPDYLLPDTLKYYLSYPELILNFPVYSKNYEFEGYRIWQFSDKEGNDGRIIAVTDKTNLVFDIKHFLNDIPGINYPGPVIHVDNKGLYRYMFIDNDNGKSMNNGSPYYFGITSFAYSKFSDPPFIESEPFIVEAIPGRPPIGDNYPYPSQSSIFFEHTEGIGDGTVHAKVIDPNLLNGHNYQITFSHQITLNRYCYNLIDETEGDTLIMDNYDYKIDSLHRDIIDGFILIVENTGYLELGGYISKVRYIREIKGPEGTGITPVNVFSTSSVQNRNSTGEWTIMSVNEIQQLSDNLQDLGYKLNIGTDDYEIRFTARGSEYYSAGYRAYSSIIGSDPKGKGKVPFEVWRIPSDTGKQPERLVIKIFDANRDTSWSQDTVTGQWESFYTFEPIGGYPDPFPSTSTSAIGSNLPLYYKLGNLVIKGGQPKTGTVIKMSTWKPLSSLDKFTAVMTAPKLNSPELTKQNINNISAFPNPYFSTKSLSEQYPPYIRFTNLPEKITIRIFSLSGVFIKKIEKDWDGQYVDWDLRNKDGLQVASGVYLAYLEIPGVATKVMKIALVK